MSGLFRERVTACIKTKISVLAIRFHASQIGKCERHLGSKFPGLSLQVAAFLNGPSQDNRSDNGPVFNSGMQRGMKSCELLLE